MKFDNKFDKEFDKKFKNEMDLLSPSEEQIERITKAVYERIEREKLESASAAKRSVKPKKPLRIKIAAISGTVCAAALVIAVIGIRKNFDIPLLSGGSSGFNTAVKGEGSFGYDMSPNAGGTDYIPPEDNGGNSVADAAANVNNADGITGKPSNFDGFDDPGYTSVHPTTVGVPGMTQTTGASSSNTLYLSFSEDKKSCKFTENGKTTDYERSDVTAGIEAGIGSDELCFAENDLGEKLFVHFDGNDLYVFYGSGELFGHYKAK